MHFANSSQKRRLATTEICILAVLTALAGRSSLAAEEVVLCQGNYQTEAQAKEQLAKFAATYSNVDQWRARADNIRGGILKGAGLNPLPKKTALNPIVHSKRKPDGTIDESFVTVQKYEDLYVFNDDHPRPDGAVKPGAVGLK